MTPYCHSSIQGIKFYFILIYGTKIQDQNPLRPLGAFVKISYGGIPHLLSQAVTSFLDASTALFAAANSASESKPATLHFTSSLNSVDRPSTALFDGGAGAAAGGAAKAPTGSRGVPHGVSFSGGREGAAASAASPALVDIAEEDAPAWAEAAAAAAAACTAAAADASFAAAACNFAAASCTAFSFAAVASADAAAAAAEVSTPAAAAGDDGAFCSGAAAAAALVAAAAIAAR